MNQGSSSMMSNERKQKLMNFTGLTDLQKFICNLTVNVRIAADNGELSPNAYHIFSMNINAIAGLAGGENLTPEQSQAVNKLAGEYMTLFYRCACEEASEHTLATMPTEGATPQ